MQSFAYAVIYICKMDLCRTGSVSQWIKLKQLNQTKEQLTIESDGESYTYMKRERIRQSYLDIVTLTLLSSWDWMITGFHFSCSHKEATMVNKHAHSLLDESLQSSLWVRRISDELYMTQMMCCYDFGHVHWVMDSDWLRFLML